MNEKGECHWVFRAHLVDRVGALTSIASAFSNEGVSIDTVVGHGMEEEMPADGSVVLTFFCNEEKKDIMVRKVRRLSKVTSLEEKPYDSKALRKSVILESTRKLVPRDVAGEETFLTCELVKREDEQWIYFLTGSPREIDRVLIPLAKEGVIKDVVYSIVGL
ncbi:MAG: hypothetical protein JXB26_09810 [Candidatus Aminicenantes bacterium]|nr:hypothetical protein [Candidatus Aminicenantes bacterium]